MAPRIGGFGGKPLVDGMRCSFADKDAGSVNSRSYWRDRGRRSAGEKRAPAAQAVLRQTLLVTDLGFLDVVLDGQEERAILG